MRPFISSAFLAISLLATSVATSSEAVNGHAPSPDRCPGAKVISTSQVPTEGAAGNVTIAHFSCDHGSSLAERSVSRLLASRGPILDERRGGLAKRDQAECTDPNQCKCGESCVTTCNKLTSIAPTASNCQSIATSMAILGTNNAIGQTFFVDPGNSVLAFFSDCEFEWDNISRDTIEFCWDDFANTELAIERSCISGGNTGAVCKSINNDWQLSLAFV